MRESFCVHRTTPPVSNLTINRRQNVLALFQQYAEGQMRAGVAPKGMEQSFAQVLQISPSMWSQIKSSRPIGDKLARQIEVACAQLNGWLDEEHAPAGTSTSEQQFMALALQAWRATNAEGRKRLKQVLKDAMAAAGPEVRSR
jgi:hypothetical protein